MLELWVNHTHLLNYWNRKEEKTPPTETGLRSSMWEEELFWFLHSNANRLNAAQIIVVSHSISVPTQMLYKIQFTQPNVPNAFVILKYPKYHSNDNEYLNFKLTQANVFIWITIQKSNWIEFYAINSVYLGLQFRFINKTISLMHGV